MSYVAPMSKTKTSRPSPSMMTLLRRVAATGDEGLPPTSLVGAEGPTFHRLRAAGLAETRSGGDYGRYRIHLTDAGRALVAQ